MHDLFPSWFVGETFWGYGTLPIPDPLDEKVGGLIRTFLAFDDKDRRAFGEALSSEQRQIFAAFGERMASRAVRSGDEDDIFLGLVALGIDGWRGDWRDNAVLLALHFDACGRIGVSPLEVFRKAARLLSSDVSSKYEMFLRRLDHDKSLHAMGYEVGCDEQGFRYQRTW